MRNCTWKLLPVNNDIDVLCLFEPVVFTGQTVLEV